MLRTSLFLLGVPLVVAGCVTGELTQQEEIVEEEAVQRRFEAWVSAQNNAEIDSVIDMYMQSDELLVVEESGRRNVGWEAQRDAVNAFYDAIDWVNFVPQTTRVNVLAPRVATVSFRHSTTVDTPNDRTVAAGNGILIWEKDPDDGVWKIRFELRAVNSSMLGLSAVESE